MNNIASMLVVLTVGLIMLRGVMTKTDCYAVFLRGAQQGMQSALSLLPALCGMMLMLSMLTASGLTRLLTQLLAPLTGVLGLPEEVTPMLLLRPLSGSGSLTVMQQIFAVCGPDSRAGNIASVLMGSSETILYTMSVYLGAAGVQQLPDVLWVSLVSYLVGAAVCGWIL